MPVSEAAPVAAPDAVELSTRVGRPRRGFAFYRNGTFVGLLIGYAAYYLCRQNLNDAYLPMKAALGLDPILFGRISSFGTLMYAVGKFAFGPLADAKGGKLVFYVGLAGSVAASLVFSLGSGVVFFAAVWGVNRLFQSLGWGGVVSILARWFPSESYGTAMGFMSMNYQFGGVAASLFVAALMSRGVGWRGLFVAPALVLGFIGLAGYRAIVNSPEDVGHALPAADGERSPMPREKVAYFGLFKRLLTDPMFLVMCALSFILTLLRECFSVWMPAYFFELGAAASTAAFKSAIFPLLGCLGTLFAGWFSDRFLGGRRAPVMGFMLLGLIGSLLGLSRLDAAARLLQVLSPAFDRNLSAFCLVGATGFFLLGPYSLVGGGVVALDFGGREAASTAVGLLDGIGYLGAMLAGVGVAELVVARGWPATFRVMSGLTVAALALCAVLWKVRPKAG